MSVLSAMSRHLLKACQDGLTLSCPLHEATMAWLVQAHAEGAFGDSVPVLTPCNIDKLGPHDRLSADGAATRH